MALRQLFQRLFDASSDSDIPKNVPFTFVMNTLILFISVDNLYKWALGLMLLFPTSQTLAPPGGDRDP